MLTSLDTRDTAVTAEHEALSRLSPRARRDALDVPALTPGQYLLAGDRDDRVLIPLTRDVTHVGRGFNAHVRLDDHRVSRRHAIVVREDGRVRVLDDRSTNGTYVNGRRVAAAELRHGDMIVLGDVMLRYVEVGA